MVTEPQDSSPDWRDGTVPVSRRFGDIYFSAEDGLAETRHVFLRGNGLEDRWPGARGFTLAELGFGTGLNFLAAWALWRRLAAPGAVLDYAGFEIAPLEGAAMARAWSRWPGLEEPGRALLAVWRPGGGTMDLPGARLTLVTGDARATLPRWPGRADAWFLDGFAPARNPELWEPGLLAEVAAHTAPGGSFATYSAAGAVRRALSAAGFAVRRAPGFGHKREMSLGRLATPAEE